MKKIKLEKQRQSGNRRSHAMNAKRRSWKGNVQVTKVLIDGQQVQIKGTAREIKSIKRQLANK